PDYSFGSKLTGVSSPLLLGDAEMIKKQITFDTSGNVVLTETFEGEEIRAPLVIPLSAYLSAISANNERLIFTDIFSERFKGSTQDDLSKLFKNITDITIPLPFKSESIFGPPTFNLKLNGSVDITASFQNSNSEVTNTFGTSNSNSAINFRQEVQLTAKGKVGDKLSIDADYNTQRLFDFENQLKIEYNGYTDEVVKRILGGNVTLDTRSGLIGSSQALFGVKGDFQLGALSLSAVVSQKKSKTEVKDFSRGVQEEAFNLKVWDYSDSHFFLDTIYKASFLDYFNNENGVNETTTLLSVNDQTFEVWVQTDVTTTGYRKAGLHVDLGPLPPTGKYNDTLKSVPTIEQGIRTYGIVRKLSLSEYSLNKYAGYISLKINIPENYFVGIAYQRTNTGEQFGTISTDSISNPDDTLVLKMVKVQNLIPSNTQAWALKLKNIYRLPVSRVVQDGFEFDVKYNLNNVPQPNFEGVSTPIIQILGLDKHTSGRAGPPNNIFDYIPGITIDPEAGFVIFPSLEPFYNNLRAWNNPPIDSAKWYPQIYSSLKSTAKELPNANLFSIIGKARGEAGISNTINLGFNIVEGSVVVKLGQIELNPATDYSVDYSTGTVVIKNAAALLSKDLKISYETNDLFTLASKTFVGLRGDYKISEKSALGFTYVNLNQATLNDKVRIGEEPTDNSMFGVDFTAEIPSKFLTNVVNLLPGFNSKEPSFITLRGELASLNADPNTLKSDIPGDNNEAIAYIDDFEGAKKIVSLGGTYNSWTMASVPLSNYIVDCDTCITQKNSRRSKIKWYNIANSVDIRDIYPQKSVQPTQTTVTPLDVTFYPGSRGTYNYNGRFDTLTDRTKNWNGIMKYLNTTSNDLVNDNINFIEFSMKIERRLGTENGKLVIDLGNISQDAIPNNILNTEDSLQNGTLLSSNDLGLDFQNDEKEAQLFESLNPGLTAPADPALDNFVASNNDPAYDFVNGTQNNGNSDVGRRPDTEDLNKSNNVRNGNDYFQFEIDLETENNPYIVGVGRNGWRQYKIPLSEFRQKYGNAVFTNIQFARMWVTGVTDSIKLSLYEINLTGNQWIKPNKTDTTYNITTVSIEENPQIYKSPIPGDVLRQTVRGQNNQNTLSNEQSLSIEIFNLTNGERKVARKDFSSSPLDLINYRTMKMFINGDPSFNYTSESIYDAAMVIRFGTDSNNYYEYRAPIHPEARLGEPEQPWDKINYMTINFNDLTKLKSLRDSANVPVQAPDPGGPPGSEYKVFGNPDLKTIREILIGVEKNRNSLNASISGSVWFDELRLINVIDDNGLAFNVSANVQMADLLNVSFAYSKVDPFFHSLDARLGSRNTGVSWDFSTTLNLHRLFNNAFTTFLSEEWGNVLTLPLTYRHSETYVNPQYYPGTDIYLNSSADEVYDKVLRATGSAELAETAKQNTLTEAQTLVIRNNISISNMNFNFPGNNYVVKNFFNRVSFNFSADFGSSRDITYESKNDFRYNGGISLGTDFGLSNILNLNIGNIIPLGESYKAAKMYFFFPFIPLAPLFSSNFNASTDFNRFQSESKQRKLIYADITSNDFRANRGFRFDWKFLENWIFDLNGNYDFRVGSDLTPLVTNDDSLRTQRPNGDIFGDIFFNNGVVNFGNDLDYIQTVTFNPKLTLPFLDKYITFNTNYNVRYGWLNPNQIINVGFNTGYTNTLSTSANLKLKEIFSIFGNGTQNNLRTSGNARDTIAESSSQNQSLLNILKVFLTFIPGDINITYSQNNTVSNAGVAGKPGFGNFWFYPTTQPNMGPSRSYQLGVSQYPGTRAPNLNQIADNYTEGNELAFQTNLNPVVPEFVNMSLNFKTAWGFANNLIYSSNGVGDIGNPTSKTSSIFTGNSMFFAGNIENFTYEYVPGNTAQNRRNITSAFQSEIGSIPFPNWTLTISGLEKFAFFSQFANSVTLDNSFIAEYKESRLIDINNYDIPNSQSVTQAFSPLIGLNFNFKEVMGGNLTSTFRINTSTTNTLNPIGALVQSISTNEWSINMNFSKTGFSIPLFGLSLQNDVQFALTLSKTTNDPINYEFGTGLMNKVVGNGSSVTNFNPTIQYSLSSKVSMQFFYKYIKTQPTNESLTTVPRTTNEGGLNIRITIQ
ncbi:MAG: cell surface protein SprA, partial [Ignavibacteria bacterium]|nr:cell surface protein SprA [Ignavibacteria bacterium]